MQRTGLRRPEPRWSGVARSAGRSIRDCAAAMGKTMPLARTHHGAAWRKQQLKIARLTAPVDMTPRRPRTRSLSEYEYARASMMDQARSDRIKQRYRRPDLG